EDCATVFRGTGDQADSHERAFPLRSPPGLAPALPRDSPRSGSRHPPPGRPGGHPGRPPAHAGHPVPARNPPGLHQGRLKEAITLEKPASGRFFSFRQKPDTLIRPLREKEAPGRMDSAAQSTRFEDEIAQYHRWREELTQSVHAYHDWLESNGHL